MAGLAGEKQRACTGATLGSLQPIPSLSQVQNTTSVRTAGRTRSPAEKGATEQVLCSTVVWKAFSCLGCHHGQYISSWTECESAQWELMDLLRSMN